MATFCGLVAAMLICLAVCTHAMAPSAGPGRSTDHPERVRQGGAWHRILWPVVGVVAVWVTPLMTWGYRQRLQRRISRASLTGWTPPQFVALQLVLGLLGGVVGTTLAAMLDGDILASVWSVGGVLLGVGLASFWPIWWLQGRRRQSITWIARQLPFFLDMVTMGLDCGLNMQSSVQLALEYLPHGPLKDAWLQALLDMRAGATRAEALRKMAATVDLAVMRQLVAALIQGESMGLSLARIIGEYARQQRLQRMMVAEKLALQAPVKMLFPLALCIFPCTFLVLGFPVAVQLFDLAP